VAIVVTTLAILVGLSNDRADACASGTADDSSFETAAEDGAKSRSAGSTDEGSLTRTDAALVAAVIVVIVVAVVIVLAAVTTRPDTVVEPVVALGAGVRQGSAQKERNDQNDLTNLHDDVGCLQKKCERHFFQKISPNDRAKGGFVRVLIPRASSMSSSMVSKIDTVQNKFRIRVPFFALKKRPSSDQLYHAIHHNLPSKNHVLPRTFSKNPCKNTKTHAKTTTPKKP
jgi:hypothetical protein